MTREAGEGKVANESIREAGVSALGILGKDRTSPLRSLGTPSTENRAGVLHAEAVKCILLVGREMKTEVPAKIEMLRQKKLSFLLLLPAIPSNRRWIPSCRRPLMISKSLWWREDRPTTARGRK